MWHTYIFTWNISAHFFFRDFSASEPKTTHGPTNIKAPLIFQPNPPDPNHRHHGISAAVPPPHATKPPWNPPHDSSDSLREQRPWKFHHPRPEIDENPLSSDPAIDAAHPVAIFAPTAKTTASQQQHRIPSASKPPGGASTCTWYSQPGTFYFVFAHISYKILTNTLHFLQAFFNFIWNMVITAKTTTSQQQHRIPSASKPPGGASTCTWYSQPGTFYLFCAAPFIMHLILYKIISQMNWFFYHDALGIRNQVRCIFCSHFIWKY